METTTDDPTDAPERLFKVTSTVTLRKERDGRTRRYDGVPVVWEVDRSAEEAPFDVMQAVEESEPVRAGSAASLFTREEALRFLEDLEEEWPEGEHRLQSVPTPAPTSELVRYERTLRDGSLQPKGNVQAVRGHPYLRKAEREGWEDGDRLLVETTLELPVELAERLRKQRDVAGYLERLEETAEAVSKIPTPHSVGDSELPF